MFITRKRLEEIKSRERWEHERELNREREIQDIWSRLFALEREIAILKGEEQHETNTPLVKGE